MRNWVNRLVPARARRARAHALRFSGSVRTIAPAYYDDYRRYLRHSSSMGPFSSLENLRGKITATYHNLEKGLSLAVPRPGFGEAQVGNLLLFLGAYVEAYGIDAWLSTPIGVLRAYRDFQEGTGVAVPRRREIDALLDEVAPALGDALVGGTRQVDRVELEQAIEGVGLEFFTSRASVRQYSNEPVSRAKLEFAAAAAQRAPAVCNRQYNQLYVFQDSQQVATILNLQGGARGFGDQLAGVAIVTSDLRNFWAAGERHQAWVDGGLFAMNFVLGLHAQRVGSVCLNWSKTPEADRALRALAGLPEQSVIIMLVGFGELLPSYSVADSRRVPLDDTLHFR